MKNLFDREITFLSIIKFTIPTVIMMVFFSMYTIIDGVFISRFVGADALSSVNIVYPVISLLTAIAVMFATGGSAIVAKTMGEKRLEEAREKFTLITVCSIFFGIIVAVLCILFIKPIIMFLGSTDNLYNNCYYYLLIMIIFTPFLILKMYFDYFFVTAGKARLGLVTSILGGIINVVLDYVFIVIFKMGVSGAAFATSIGYAIPSIIGIIYFLDKKNTLYFVKFKFDFNTIKNSCTNGISEMVTQLSSAVTTFVYNIVMINFLGADGVASITIILYVNFLLIAVYLGFTSGVAPWISYNFGSKNAKQLKKIIKYSYIYIFLFSLISFIVSRLGSEILIGAFAVKGTDVYNISLNGFDIFSFSFLISGFNMFTIGMFTAFSNGKISAVISLMRTLVLFLIGISVFPAFLGVNGVWIVVPFSEILTLILGLTFVYKFRDEYMYGNILLKSYNCIKN
ncbi:MAG: MATE family efflux transporter [Sarcina ventriculi]|uniref:MATE family efflux transporter n=1 Tax=Sarcina ventriculi TaxID=1267 RepID=UPI00073F051B|nr:MATE family efflux transporter [Sarcina ventriculi]MDD7374150.1 MATE family efflux transporter [Sarcina ventriculi]